MAESFPVEYLVLPADPAAHLFEVRCRIAAPDPAGQRLSLPAWIPGSYMIRDFARHVVSLAAACDGAPLEVVKIDKATWQCAPAAGAVEVMYEVYAWDLSVRGAHLDAGHGFFNGTSLFLRVHGREAEACRVELLAPPGAAFEDWRVATTLPRLEAELYGFGSYRAEDYDALIDHPVEMGRFTLAEFEACGVPHAVAVTGRHDARMGRLCRDLRSICETHIRLFGEPAPVRRYLFLVTAVGEGYGGLEHRASTALLCKRDDLPRGDAGPVDDAYRSFLGLCSHEYFHTWNVKRIKPAAFSPYNLEREVHTRLLWAFEGITSYYDDLALVRSKRIDVPSYLELLGRTITRVWRTPGRFRQSLAESSFDAWTKFYRQDENAPNAIVSYYAKGALVALALDLHLRLETAGRVSLDDLMRLLWERFGRTGTGVPEDALRGLAEEVSGLDLGAFFTACVASVEDPPLADLLGRFGVRMTLRPAESLADQGGKPAAEPLERLLRRGDLGIRLKNDAGEARLAAVLDGGAARRAGLSAGDVICAVDGLRATATNLEALIGAHPPGRRVRIHAFRRDELLECEALLQAPAADTCVLTLDEDDGDPSLRSRRDAWWFGAGAAEAAA